MNKVYAVGCLEIDFSEKAKKLFLDQRLWYLFSDFISAEKFILKNNLNIFENNFNFAVIEEIELVGESSFCLEVPKQWWYSPTRQYQEVISVEATEAPPCVKNISYIWVG